ncbi:hypothetical protein D9M69_688720 [compost metagenome]
MRVQHFPNLVAHAHQRVQGSHRLLEDHADALATQCAHFYLVECQQIIPLEEDATGHRSDSRFL